MKKLRNIISLMAVCATAALFTGCGDDNDTIGGGNPPPNSPDSLSGHTYTLTDSGGTSTLAFDAAAMNYTLTQGAGATESGTYTAHKSGDVWTVNATDANGNPATVTLTFSGVGTGNYTLQRGDQTTTGSFAASDPGGTSTSSGTDTGTSTSSGTDTGTSTSSGTDTGTSTSSGTDTGTSTSSGTDTGTSTSTGPVGTLPAPQSLSQIVVTTGTGGIGAGTVYTVTLNPNGTFSAVNNQGDSMGSGTYQYTPAGNQANLRLTYPDFGSDNDNMTLFFTSPAGGGANQYTGTQVVSGTSYNMTGTFTY
jgi:hypothetical protein